MQLSDIKFHFKQTEKDGYAIVLDSPIVFHAHEHDYTIENGYESNGMSVPRIFWGFISPRYDPSTIIPSIIHDWLYDNHVMSRKESDVFYKGILIKRGYPVIKAHIVYYAIRAFGYFHWNIQQ